MRILVFTGKGGVGKSTVAAGTAALCAARGRRTLVLSTDGAHSLSDAFGAGPRPGHGEPVEVAPCLWVQHLDAQRRFEESWEAVRGYLVGVLDTAGLDAVSADELTVLPGAEEVLALLEVRRQVMAGGPDARGWDVVVVDCAPTAETLRLLALPEALGSYLDRVLPGERRVVRALAPVLARASGVPVPDEDVLSGLMRLRSDLDDVRRLLSGPQASVRLVTTPEQMVLAEARRSWTTLSLFGYRVDGVVANRVFAAGEAQDPWRAGWVRAQRAVLAEADTSFPAVPLWRAEYGAAEPVGVDALTRLAEQMYAGQDPCADGLAGQPGTGLRIETPDGSGARAVLCLPLPGARRDDVDLARRGHELIVTVGSYRRLLALPAALADAPVAGAGVEDGELRVRFAAEPREAGA